MVCRRVLCYVVTVSTRSIVHILVLSIVLWNFLLYYLSTYSDFCRLEQVSTEHIFDVTTILI